MAFDEFKFNPILGWGDWAEFPTIPANEVETRALMQKLFNQLRDEVNTLYHTLNSTEDGASGADSIAATAIEGLNGQTVQALLESTKSVSDTLNNDKADKATTYLRTEVDAKDDTLLHNIETHKGSGDHDNRYYKKEELTPFLRGGDTLIREEVYTIVAADNGDGTFTYSDGVNAYTGELTEEGYQTFNLLKGNYILGMNRVEIIVGDTLRRSVNSGGLVEIDETHVALTQPEGAGAEITIKYYERIGLAAEYNIKMSTIKPPLNDGKTMWFEVIG